MAGAGALAGMALPPLIARGGGAQELRLGADPDMASLLGEVAAAYHLAHPGVRAYVDPESADTLLPSVGAGRLDGALISGEAPRGLPARRLGDREFAVVVGPQNPIAGLAEAQVRSLFSESTTLWDDLGWAGGGPITPVERAAGADVEIGFRAALGLNETSPAGNAYVANSDAQTLALVGAHSSYAGFVDARSLTTGSRGLAVDGQVPGGAAYPLRTPVWLVVRPDAPASDFAAFCSSPAGQAVLRQLVVAAA
jgi:hypothetical protein